MFRLSYYPVFDSYLLVATVGLLLLGLMWFGPSREKTQHRHRLTLVLLRVAVIVLVMLAMLRPTLIYTQTKKEAATFVVMIDATRSMSVPDDVGNKTRWEALRGAVADAAPALARLQQDFELKAYTFDSEIHEVGSERGKIRLPDKPEGQQTAIGASLDDVLGREAGKRLLAVVLLTDGRSGPTPPAICPRKRPPPGSSTSAIRCSRSPSASRAGWARPATWP